MSDKGLPIVGGALALLLLAVGRSEAKSAAKSEATKQKSADGEWMPALLSEYHPDAPESEREMEGGIYDRNPRKKTLAITVQQFQSDKQKYPYISVSGDLVLRGKSVPYGCRIYLAAYPDLVFRLVDTGGRFFGKNKKIRKEGYEPFDIATNYKSKLGFAGKETFYRLDRKDLIVNRADVA